jgi:hypothetical protein
MTPEDALWHWEESHHELSEEHRASFKLKVQESSILDYPEWAVRSAIAGNKRLADAASAAASTLAAVREVDRRAAAAREQPKKTASRPKPSAQKQKTPPKGSTSKKKPRPTSGSPSAYKPMENTDPYRSASGRGRCAGPTARLSLLRPAMSGRYAKRATGPP